MKYVKLVLWPNDERGWHYTAHDDDLLNSQDRERLEQHGYFVIHSDISTDIFLQGDVTKGWVIRPGSKR